MLRQPLDVELAAAAAVAARVGLGDVTPELIHLGNHTTARLSPWPLVARIASGTTYDPADPGLERELAVASHLARQEAPTIRPADAVSPGPYHEGGCAISLWEHAIGRPVGTAADAVAAAESLQRIHIALADYQADLPPFTAKVRSCETILHDPARATALAAEDRLFLQDLHKRMCRDLSGVGGTWQPLHGDAHVGNALVTDAGAIWLDWESVCVGPREWDVGFLPPATWTAFPGIDKRLVRKLADARSFCVATWCWAEFDRSAATREAAIYHLQRLKRRFA